MEKTKRRPTRKQKETTDKQKAIPKKLVVLSPIYVKRTECKEDDWKYNQEIPNTKCTQTSKTILELALLDQGKMSADSFDVPLENRNNPPLKKQPSEHILYSRNDYEHPPPQLSSVNSKNSGNKSQTNSETQYMGSQWVHTEESSVYNFSVDNQQPVKKESEVSPGLNTYSRTDYQHPRPHVSTVSYKYPEDKSQTDYQNQYIEGQWVHTNENSVYNISIDKCNTQPVKNEYDIYPEPNSYTKSDYQHPRPHVSTYNYRYPIDKSQIDSKIQYVNRQWAHTKESSVPHEVKTFVNGYYVEQPCSDVNLHQQDNIPTTEIYTEHNPALNYTKASKMHFVESSPNRPKFNTEVFTEIPTERNNYSFQEHYKPQYVLNNNKFKILPSNPSEKQYMNSVLHSSYTKDIYPTLEEPTNKISDGNFKSKQKYSGKNNVQSVLKHSHICDGSTNFKQTQNVSPNVPIMLNVINNKGEKGNTKKFVGQQIEKSYKNMHVNKILIF